MPGEGINQSLPMGFVMEKHHRRLTARIGIGQQQTPEPPQQRLGWRQRIGRRPRGAHGGTGAAARANLRTDHHLVLERTHPRRNRPGWAKVQAAPAAFALVARMGAELAIETHETRLVETADQLARRDNRAFKRSAIGWIGATDERTLHAYARSRSAVDRLSARSGRPWTIGRVPILGDGHIESPTAPVAPRSLYLQQLADRLGPAAVAVVTAKTAGPAL